MHKHSGIQGSTSSESVRGDHTPALPEKAPFQHGAVAKIGGQWLADVYDGEKKGRGQAASWTDAMNAAIEDLKEKKS